MEEATAQATSLDRNLELGRESRDLRAQVGRAFGPGPLTGALAILSFAIVLVVGFWRHGLHFFSLFVPHGTPLPMIPIIAPIEFISFMVRPFSLGLRLFVAMIAGHILMEVFGSFIVSGFNGGPMGWGVGILSLLFIIFVSALELLVCAIQAYVFALLTSLYLNDAENLH